MYRRRFGGRIGQVERGNIEIAGQLVRLGQTRRRIIGGFAGHGDRAFGHHRQRFGPGIRGGHHRLFLTDQNPQAQIDAFGSLGLFQRPFAHINRQRPAFDCDRVSRFGAGL